MNKVRAHIQYKNSEGILVPGVTTVLQVLNKPSLVKWANNLGLQGIDSTKYVDEKASIGTLAHYFIMCHFKQIEPDTQDYSARQIDQAENSLLSFFEWEKFHGVEPILVEAPLVSEQHQYGGTIDLYGRCEDSLVLIDFKTGKGLYEDMTYQVASYRQLLIENGYEVNATKILRIGRDENEGFEEKTIYDYETGWQIFLHCLAIYRLKKANGR